MSLRGGFQVRIIHIEGKSISFVNIDREALSSDKIIKTLKLFFYLKELVIAFNTDFLPNSL